MTPEIGTVVICIIIGTAITGMLWGGVLAAYMREQDKIAVGMGGAGSVSFLLIAILLFQEPLSAYMKAAMGFVLVFGAASLALAVHLIVDHLSDSSLIVTQEHEGHVTTTTCTEPTTADRPSSQTAGTKPAPTRWVNGRLWLNPPSPSGSNNNIPTPDNATGQNKPASEKRTAAPVLPRRQRGPRQM